MRTENTTVSDDSKPGNKNQEPNPHKSEKDPDVTPGREVQEDPHAKPHNKKGPGKKDKKIGF